jgi:hypothetical protein
MDDKAHKLMINGMKDMVRFYIDANGIDTITLDSFISWYKKFHGVMVTSMELEMYPLIIDLVKAEIKMEQGKCDENAHV